jgi:hypothetical protein
MILIKLEFIGRFLKNIQKPNFKKSLLWVASSMQMDGQT